MRTDRELLELAAKVAGRGYVVGRDWHDKGELYVDGRYWNPLTDDGDALRLAVKLEMDIFFNDGDTDVMGASEGGGDPFARTRRAIVRAAAEIGAQVAEPAHNEIGDGNG